MRSSPSVTLPKWTQIQTLNIFRETPTVNAAVLMVYRGLSPLAISPTRQRYVAPPFSRWFSEKTRSGM